MVGEPSLAGPKIQMARGFSPYTPGTDALPEDSLPAVHLTLLRSSLHTLPTSSFPASHLSLASHSCISKPTPPSRTHTLITLSFQPPSQTRQSHSPKLSLFYPTHHNISYQNVTKHTVPPNQKSPLSAFIHLINSTYTSKLSREFASSRNPMLIASRKPAP